MVVNVSGAKALGVSCLNNHPTISKSFQGRIPEPSARMTPTWLGSDKSDGKEIHEAPTAQPMVCQITGCKPGAIGLSTLFSARRRKRWIRKFCAIQMLFLQSAIAHHTPMKQPPPLHCGSRRTIFEPWQWNVTPITVEEQAEARRRRKPELNRRSDGRNHFV